MLLTFGLTVLAWIFFRAEDVNHAIEYITGIISNSLFTVPQIRPTNILLLIIFFIISEWFGRNNKFALENLQLHYPKIIRYLIYIFLATVILLFSGGKKEAFIYFQF
jgi:hypothetical protein